MNLPFTSNSLILIGLAARFGLCAAEAQSTDGEVRPPNIVFILADDLGWSLGIP